MQIQLLERMQVQVQAQRILELTPSRAKKTRHLLLDKALGRVSHKAPGCSGEGQTPVGAGRTSMWRDAGVSRRALKKLARRNCTRSWEGITKKQETYVLKTQIHTSLLKPRPRWSREQRCVRGGRAWRPLGLLALGQGPDLEPRGQPLGTALQDKL